MLTVAENRKLYPFMRYIERAVGKAHYWTWRGGVIPDDEYGGAYAENGPVPDVDRVIRQGIFCAGVPNLALRKAGKIVPYRPSYPDRRYDGGIAAYFSGYWGAGYFTGYDDPFDLATAKRWARDTRSGVLLGKGYWGVALGNQGHTGILLPSGYVLQSTPAGGLNWDSHIDWEWRYWEAGGVMLHPEQWIEYATDVADWAKN